MSLMIVYEATLKSLMRLGIFYLKETDLRNIKMNIGNIKETNI